MDLTPGTRKAIDKMLDAITGDEVVYPSGTTFIGMDVDWVGRAVADRWGREGARSIVLVATSGTEVVIGGVPAAPATFGAETHSSVTGFITRGFGRLEPAETPFVRTPKLERV